MSRCSRLVDSDATETDAAVERHFARLRGELLPDPLFRRRLRSHAINHFVASRERHEVRELSSGRQSRMGRLGRASLFASVALAMSAAAVLGVSQEALPGDPLYGVKLRVEELRFAVAPAELQPMLVAIVVGERLEEMSRLVDDGRLDDAVAMGPVVKREIERLAESGQGGGGAARVARVAHQLQVLDELINRLPPQAQAAIKRSWDELTSRPVDGEPPATTNPGGAGSGTNGSGGNGSGGNGSGHGGGPGSGGNSSAGGAGGAGSAGGADGAGPGNNSSGNPGGNNQGGSGANGNDSNQGGSKNQGGNSGGAAPSQDPPRDNARPTPIGSPSSE